MVPVSFNLPVDGGISMSSIETEKPKKTVGSKVTSVIGVILCIILIPMLIINLTIIVKSFVHPDEVPGFMGYKPFIDLSNSMLPVIEAGDLILVKYTDPTTLVKGDIISYREGNSVITHRIVDVSTSEGGVLQFSTRGDNNNTDDPDPVLLDAVEGKMLFTVHKLGNAALFMQTKPGMLIFIVLPLVLLVAYDVLRRRTQNRGKNKETLDLEKELERMRSLLAEKEAAAGSKDTETAESPEIAEAAPEVAEAEKEEAVTSQSKS